MLDPLISAELKRHGVLKFLTINFPHLLVPGVLALSAFAIAVYTGHKRLKADDGKNPYCVMLQVMRPNDARLKYIKVWKADEVDKHNKVI